MSYLSKQCAMLIIKLLRPIVHNQSVALGALNGEDTVLSTRTKGSCGDKEEVEGRGGAKKMYTYITIKHGWCEESCNC